jgi:hypothetical protein
MYVAFLLLLLLIRSHQYLLQFHTGSMNQAQLIPLHLAAKNRQYHSPLSPAKETCPALDDVAYFALSLNIYYETLATHRFLPGSAKRATLLLSYFYFLQKGGTFSASNQERGWLIFNWLATKNQGGGPKH